MAVLTKCPQCETVFRVSAEQLRAAGGWVRCGRCATEFNAIAKLTDSREDRAIAINLDDGPQPEAALENLVVAGDRAAGPARRFREGGWRNTLWTLGSVALLLLLAGQYLWQQQASLARDPQWRPWIVQFCNISGCEVKPFRELDALVLRKRDLRMDPQRTGVLVVNAILVNRAVMEQPFPLVELKLKDRNNRTVATRRFPVDEYLNADSSEAGQMSPEVPYHLRLELLMPDGEPVNFGFRFL